MVKAWMQSRDDFDSEDSLRQYLATQLSRGRLSMLIGAGVSTAFGLPDWRGLLERLFGNRGEVPPQRYSLTRQAEHYRDKFHQGDDVGFIKSVHDALYHGVDASFEKLRTSKTLAAIGSLVMASCRGSIAEVVTFNWDNLLELYLAYHGFVTGSLATETHWAGVYDVSVLHPHGFIPFRLEDGASEGIVFDQISYSAVIGDEARPWRQRLLSIMRRHTCLFIGLSGDDPNLDSLLCVCQPEHASQHEKTAFWGARFTTSADPVEHGFWEKRGVYCKVLGDYENGLPDFVFSVCQEAAMRRTP